MERFDVAIVGAGPAGSTAAHRLAASGLSVVLLDKALFPRYKTCGGGVVGRARRWFEAPIDKAVEHECYRAEIHLLDAGVTVDVARPQPIVAMTMRSTLDAVLAEAAAEAGAQLRTGVRVTSVDPKPTEVIVRTAGGGAGEAGGAGGAALRASFVLAADGATGNTARASGWPANASAVPALECEVRVPDRVHLRFAAAARFDFGCLPHGYGWVFPKKDCLSVGVLSTRRGHVDLERQLSQYLRRIGITEIEGLERHGYVIPLGVSTPTLVRGRVMLVGDAAGLVDPITAEGISAAAFSARLAAEAIVASAGDADHAASVYRDSVSRHLLPELRAARLYARLLYDYPRVRAICVRRAGCSLADVVADVMSGARTYAAALGGALRLSKFLLGVGRPQELRDAPRGTQVR